MVVLNPLRDRSPEYAANGFLADLRAGNCSVSRELCAYALPEHRVSNWQLANREDAADSVALYFKLTKHGESDPWYNLTGEGAVYLRKHTTGWSVTFFSSYF
ncbi:MAG: hypothetical protein ACLQIS_13075 [Bryobacteraceae bacterium]